MFVPIPERGRIFEQSRPVGPAEVGPQGGAHLDAIAHWLQDVAFADLIDAGLLEARAWVVRRTSLEIGRLPAFAERLRVRTFCSGLAKSVAERRTSISGDRGARVEAEAIWVQVDERTRMPSRFSDDFLAIYGEAAGGRRARAKLRHPPPPDRGERIDWVFRSADLDLADHVNNAVYWEIAEQHLPGALEADRLEIEYREGSGAGPATVLRAEGGLWVLDAEGMLGASIRRSPQARGGTRER